jgi:hypothetical protein
LINTRSIDCELGSDRIGSNRSDRIESNRSDRSDRIESNRSYRLTLE